MRVGLGGGEALAVERQADRAGIVDDHVHVLVDLGVALVDQLLRDRHLVDQERPEQPVRHLHLRVVVRVVDADRRAVGDELVGEALARLDRRLRVRVDTVHRVRHLDAVEVHRGRLGQVVRAARCAPCRRR